MDPDCIALFLNLIVTFTYFALSKIIKKLYLMKSTLNQNAEISELRSSTLETFGWLEEARSREGTAEDCKYLQLLR